MKTLEDLRKLRESVKHKVSLRDDKDGYKVIVGMGTCGIASGARPILNKFIEEVGANKLDNVVVTQVGCIGECRLEPLAQVIDKDGSIVTYCNLTEELVTKIVKEHLIGGKVLETQTIDNFKG